jgi:putative transcriptional regulator
MKQLLRSINLVTKFQILVQVAANQPDIQQRDIGKRLGLSPQAVSDYFKELIKGGWLTTDGRSKYRVTREGVDWMIKGLKEWQSYSDTVQKAIAGVSVSASIADSAISRGQQVGLYMRDGLLYAGSTSKVEARGVAVSNAKKGEDVGVSNISGIVPLEVGKVTILRIPGIQKGGSGQANLNILKKAVKNRRLVGAMGIEALTVLRKIDVEPASFYGVRETVVEAARSGISPVVVCIDDDTAALILMLEERNIDYEILDGRKA